MNIKPPSATQRTITRVTANLKIQMDGFIQRAEHSAGLHGWRERASGKTLTLIDGKLLMKAMMTVAAFCGSRCKSKCGAGTDLKTSSAKPTLHNNFATIPAELKELGRWVNWQFVERDGKPTKAPVDPNTWQPASCSDPDTWGSYADALARFNSDTVDGIGFQLGSSYIGIDLDRCRNPKTGEIESQATEIIGRFSSDTEISPSGTGIHILTKGTLPPHGRRKGAIEIYSDGRFFTMTGEHLDGTPTEVHERQTELTAFTRKSSGQANLHPRQQP